MAVVEMKKVLVLCPRDKGTTLLKDLQKQATVQLVPVAAATQDLTKLATRARNAKRVQAALRKIQREQTNRKPENNVSTKQLPPATAGHAGNESDALARLDELDALTDEQLMTRAEQLLATETETETRISHLIKEHAGAVGFGDVCQEDFARLSEAGLTVRVYRVEGKRNKAKVEIPEGAKGFWVPFVDGAKRTKVLVVVSFDSDLQLEFDRLEPPQRKAAAVKDELDGAQRELDELRAQLAGFASRLDRITREACKCVDVYQLHQAKAQAGGDEQVFGLCGWCPAPNAKAVAKTVAKVSGACVFLEPGPSDEPPIKLSNPKVVSWFEPLLEAFQLPQYREPDPTFLFAPFMAVFFGFCLGDMAYGALLLLAATLLHRKLAKPGSALDPALRLMQLLGFSTVVVGFLTGAVFGYSLYEIPALQRIGLTSDKLLFFLSKDPQNLFYLSLLFGVLQLGVGIIVRLILQLKERQYQHALGTIGWLMLIPGVGLWVAKGMNQLFVAALVIIVLFKSPGSLVRRIGGGLWGLYEWVLGLFGDVMSYLRIFGLGLSSGIIAQVVNTIAWMVLESGSIGGYVGGVLILLVGHTFNFAMAVLGSTVHAARLQFLEFLGKFYEGGGQAFRPFAKSK